eukprot:6045605-Karenia_brevis.AAC.1
MKRSGSSSEDSGSNRDVIGSGFKGVHKLRKRLKKRPGRVAAQFKRRCEQDLGITSTAQHW